MNFKFRKWIFIYLLIMLIIASLISIISIKQNGLNFNTSISLLIFIFLLFVSSISYLLALDILIDNEGISKVFLGRRIFLLRWSDIKLIRDVTKNTSSGLSTRSFYLIPKLGVSLGFWSGGWIRFTDNMYGFAAFVDMFNREIRLHNLRVERIHGVDSVMCNEISQHRQR
jgi:hypothetical protein